ncbi:hypothetical protein OAM64_00575 [Candidatus Thioglobus sp.]|nr:hypothetical protein [Candidatus Thioglobus sp.]
MIISNISQKIVSLIWHYFKDILVLNQENANPWSGLPIMHKSLHGITHTIEIKTIRTQHNTLNQ